MSTGMNMSMGGEERAHLGMWPDPHQWGTRSWSAAAAAVQRELAVSCYPARCRGGRGEGLVAHML